MDRKIKDLTHSLNKNPGASSEVLTDFGEAAGLSVPEEYLEFMRVSNGAEGFIGDGGYVMLWSIENLVESNRAYKVDEYAPGLFLFGSDGGGEAYAFDTRQENLPIVRVPFVGMSLEYARPCGTSFSEFLQYLSQLDHSGGAPGDTANRSATEARR